MVLLQASGFAPANIFQASCGHLGRTQSNPWAGIMVQNLWAGISSCAFHSGALLGLAEKAMLCSAHGDPAVPGVKLPAGWGCKAVLQNSCQCKAWSKCPFMAVWSLPCSYFQASSLSWLLLVFQILDNIDVNCFAWGNKNVEVSSLRFLRQRHFAKTWAHMILRL